MNRRSFFSWFSLGLAGKVETTEEKIGLDLRTVIDILTDYSVVHQTTPLLGGYLGLTDYRERTIYVSDKSDLADRRDTIIHEMLHVLVRLKGLKDIEETMIERRARQIYTSLYGGTE